MYELLDDWYVGQSLLIEDSIPPEDVTIILPTNFCQLQLLLIIIVPSKFDKFDERMSIRNTWGGEQTVCNNSVRTYFLLGLSTNNTVQVCSIKF